MARMANGKAKTPTKAITVPKVANTATETPNRSTTPETMTVPTRVISQRNTSNNFLNMARKQGCSKT